MNYSLTSIRKIGAYKQKIITSFMRTAEGVAGVLAKMKGWHETLSGLDPQNRTVGTIEYNAYCESVGEDNTNVGYYADGIVSIVSLASGKPKTTTFRIENVQKQYSAEDDYITTVINNKYHSLTGAYANAETSYVTSVILMLHDEEEQE